MIIKLDVASSAGSPFRIVIFVERHACQSPSLNLLFKICADKI